MLLQAGLVEVLFYLEKIKDAKISVIKDSLEITQHSLYASIEKLDEYNLVIDDKQPTQRIIRITEKGEFIARKLSYVFDEEKEVFPLAKEQVIALEKACRLKEVKAEAIETWQDFIRKAIDEKYESYKVRRLLK